MILHITAYSCISPLKFLTVKDMESDSKPIGQSRADASKLLMCSRKTGNEVIGVAGTFSTRCALILISTLLHAMLFVDNVLELGKLQIWLNLATRWCAVPSVIGAVAGSFNESTEPALLKS